MPWQVGKFDFRLRLRKGDKTEICMAKVRLKFVTNTQTAKISGPLSTFKVPLEQSVTVSRFACIRFLLKPFCVFSPQSVKHIQFTEIG